MRGIGRTNDFAVPCAGLRDTGDVGFALLRSEMLELGDVTFPFAGAGPVVVAAHIEVGLEEDGGSRGCWLRHGMVVRASEQSNEEENEEPNRPVDPPLRLFAP